MEGSSDSTLHQFIELMRRYNQLKSHRETMSEENNIDPDDGNSWICSACTLPIFSTPFKISDQRSKENVKLLLHDQCASLPEKLMGHVFHPGEALHLVKNEDSSSSTISCHICRGKCGSMFYKCIHNLCDLQLDLLCSLQIKILHRSHQHRLMVIRSSVSFICAACGTQHQGRSALSYFCGACDFWIHPDCASLPNAIKLLHPKHQHSLFLNYDRSRSSSSAVIENAIKLLHIYYDPSITSSSSSSSSKCGICGDVLQSLGVYLCVKCGYYVHITCATSDPHSFQPVLLRHAKLADLPMADERANLVQYMLENTSAAGDDDGGGGRGGGDDDDDGCRHDPKLEKHSLIFHDKDNDDVSDDDDGCGHHPNLDDEKCRHDPKLEKHSLTFHDEHDDVTDDDDYDTGHSSRVCNACVQFISPPFYSCSNCRDFLLHSCCADLPRKIHHLIHQQHSLFLFSQTTEPGLQYPGFFCDGCGRMCSGFGYSCETCSYFKLDVVCALMPCSISHESHGKTHILHMSRHPDFLSKCSCCCGFRFDSIFYECSNCRQFKLHGRCALLPTTLTDKFDRHPLKLTTSTKISVLTSTNDDSDAEHNEEEMQHFCDVCETDIWKREWYYNCKQWDSSFHIDCIPFLNSGYKVKFGVSVDVNFHECPLTLVPEATISGYHCDVCREKFEYMDTDGLTMDCAYECTKCNYRVHGACADTESSEKKQ